ncbi:hypothetical protein PoB_005275900 [Plakobranchus ocellatus]|uniref:Uncharacterized protein n=1 Tax=Plakobranchus ocellatus TaxID=259542 RepID=A0AAV4C172_9GAST|nr:hypothetical protein PoB_005275900 [Plakobranchus ocellatus]
MSTNGRGSKRRGKHSAMEVTDTYHQQEEEGRHQGVVERNGPVARGSPVPRRLDKRGGSVARGSSALRSDPTKGYTKDVALWLVVVLHFEVTPTKGIKKGGPVDRGSPVPLSNPTKGWTKEMALWLVVTLHLEVTLPSVVQKRWFCGSW